MTAGEATLGTFEEVARRIEVPATEDLAFSICTLVNNPAQYERMVRTFSEGGFTGSDVEYLYIDNSAGNRYDAYTGLNCLLSHARGRYVILCHQDVALIDEGRAELEARLAELDARDPNWALAGNAGGLDPESKVGNGAKGRVAIRIAHADATYGLPGLPLPAKSLDENFIVMRNAARLGFSADLSGFHMYGADICMQAEGRGLGVYVIDFLLFHESRGGRNGLNEARQAFEAKYSRFFRKRRLFTTCTMARLVPEMPPPPARPQGERRPPVRARKPRRRPWWARLGYRSRQ